MKEKQIAHYHSILALLLTHFHSTQSADPPLPHTLSHPACTSADIESASATLTSLIIEAGVTAFGLVLPNQLSGGDKYRHYWFRDARVQAAGKLLRQTTNRLRRRYTPTNASLKSQAKKDYWRIIFEVKNECWDQFTKLLEDDPEVLRYPPSPISHTLLPSNTPAPPWSLSTTWLLIMLASPRCHPTLSAPLGWMSVMPSPSLPSHHALPLTLPSPWRNYLQLLITSAFPLLTAMTMCTQA
jgi:hypothetical protein